MASRRSGNATLERWNVFKLKIINAQGKGELKANRNWLCGLDEECVRSQLDRAPRWVIERRDRSWAARQHIGEDITAFQNDQDVLRVSTIYGLRVLSDPPFPSWLAIPTKDDNLRDRARRLSSFSVDAMTAHYSWTLRAIPSITFHFAMDIGQS